MMIIQRNKKNYQIISTKLVPFFLNEYQIKISNWKSQ